MILCFDEPSSLSDLTLLAGHLTHKKIEIEVDSLG